MHHVRRVVGLPTGVTSSGGDAELCVFLGGACWVCCSPHSTPRAGHPLL